MTLITYSSVLHWSYRFNALFILLAGLAVAKGAGAEVGIGVGVKMGVGAGFMELEVGMLALPNAVSRALAIVSTILCNKKLAVLISTWQVVACLEFNDTMIRK